MTTRIPVVVRVLDAVVAVSVLAALYLFIAWALLS